MDTRLTTTRVLKGLVPVVLLGVAGMLFVGVPAASSGDGDLPDPATMALRGQNRATSAEIVGFWTDRVETAPASVQMRTQLASAQLTLAGDSGDLDGYVVAETTATQALELRPDDPGARLTLAAARAGQHDFQGALELAESVLVDEPNSVSALLAAGDAHRELGDYGAARRRYDEASRSVGGAAAVLSRYARLEAVVGDGDEARELARRALVRAGDEDLRPTDAAFYWFQLASFEFARGEVAGAHELLDAALSIDPSHGGATELLGQVLVARGQVEAAIELYEGLVEGGGAADLHGALATLYERVGRHADAQRQVEIGLARADADARYPAERRHLIGFLAEHDPAAALRLAELDLADRTDVHSHAWYAWTLYRNGRITEAVTAIVPALAYDTDDALLLYQAGVIAHANGDAVRAESLLRRALDLNPHFDPGQAEHARSLLDTP